jgi:hypothetical protein
MCIPLTVDVAWVDVVAPSIAGVGALIITDLCNQHQSCLPGYCDRYLSLVGRATAKSASTTLLYFTRAKIFLAGKCIALWIAIDAVQLRGLSMVSLVFYSAQLRFG